MNREQLVDECNRLLDQLGKLDPASAEYDTVRRQLFGSGGKGAVQGLFTALLQLDSAAQDLIDRDVKNDLEKEKVDIERMKIALETMRFQSSVMADEAKIELEKERFEHEKAESERRLDIEQFKADTEAIEIEQREHYTRAQARQRFAEIGFETLGIAALIGLTGKVQNAGILDKNLMGFIPKFRSFK